MATFQGSGLNDTLAGSKLSDLVFGLAGNDSIGGGLGADTLDGGTGMDTLAGGGGNDTYVVDNVKDAISELAGDLNDRVLASIAVDLNVPAFANIEHATLTGTAALAATGNGGANMLIGNAGANKLDGKAGNDTAAGGGGNDVYEVDSDKDVVIEFAGEGIDQVNSTAAKYTLGAFVENLTLIGPGDDGFGNALANKITGNAGENLLLGLGGNDTLIGNDGADELLGGAGADSLVGGNGGDAYFVDDIGDKILESGPAGDADVVFSDITFTLGANLENLLLEGATGLETIDGTGNALGNSLDGNQGNNVLSGLGGNDVFEGNGGNDLLLGGDGNDVFRMEGDAGVSTLVGGAGSDIFFFFDPEDDVIADFDGLPSGDKIEVGFLLTGFAAPASNFFQTATANGSTTIKVDTNGAIGGAAFVDMVVLQGVSTDLDGLLANGTIVSNGVPIVAATPSKDGTPGNDSKIGTVLSDLIRGLAGNDSLTGLTGADTLDGGTGMDTLDGGFGNDSYVIDNAKDVIVESGGNTDDRILASIAIDLKNYLNIEHVTLTGTAALNATGNDGANMLIGNAGANKLDGKGGVDTLIGGAGNDVYEVDEFSDAVIEFAGEGVDQVNSSAFSHTLGAFIENLTLTGAALQGIGNGLANKISGTSGGNLLSGLGGNDTLIGNDGADELLGGAGADSLVGGKGGDDYFVDDIGDKIMESGPAGDLDRVFSDITFTLGATLEGLSFSGTNAIDGTGNALDNVMSGNSGANVLSGLAGADVMDGGFGDDLLLGGEGNDTLTANADVDTLVGGAGSDAFRFFSVALGGLDVIADFNGLPGGDKIEVGSLLTGFAEPAGNFFQTVTANGSTTISVDTNGTVGGLAFVPMVVLQGVSTDLDGLLANGTIFIGDLPIAPATPPIDGTAGLDNKAGTGSSDLMRGLAGDDLLTGLAGADTLDGGTGMDTLTGGFGDDSYIVDNAKDEIVEGISDLNDRVLASIAVDLNDKAFANIEHATLTGIGALNATGNGGANMLIGNAGANKLDGKGGGDTMIGGAGNDIYEVDTKTDVVIEFAGEGVDQVNSSAFSHTLGAFIENLTLTGGAVLGTGNALANKITASTTESSLRGLDGNDTLTGTDGGDLLDGGAGADSMAGGKGNDDYIVDEVGDKVAESGPASDDDNVTSTIAYTLGANLENLFLSGSNAIDGTGNALGNVIVGNDGNNVLSGLAGNDELNGTLGDDLLLGGDGNDRLVAGGGADTLVGGAGSDRYEFTAAGLSGLDVVADFNGLPGGDTIDVSNLLVGFVEDVSNVNVFLRAVQANGSTTLQVDANGAVGGAAFVDMVVLQGVSTTMSALLNNGSLLTTLAGSGLNDTLSGSKFTDLMFGLGGNDSLSGNAGTDTLDGGTGMDALRGGGGNDTYVVDNAKDAIIELVGDLNDRVLAAIAVDLNLPAFANIEHATLTGTAALAATGNGGANMLIGNAGANKLDGKGGNDTAAGGGGNDIYTVDSFFDVAIEFAGEGIDQVISKAGVFRLGEFIENLTLGDGATEGQGNELGNVITGNAASNLFQSFGGNDTLIGNGGGDVFRSGEGADSMVGGKGEDFYFVDNVGDKITESGPAGDVDTVSSTITFTLGANLEELFLEGLDAIDGTGNGLNNFILGNEGNNVLSGLAGADTLRGGNGGDDLLLGGDGNDDLGANLFFSGAATLVGGAGSDEFSFGGGDFDHFHVIADFNGLPGGDFLDFPVGQLAAGTEGQFIQTETANGSTIIRVDQNGADGGIDFLQVAVLQGVSTDLAGLLANGAILDVDAAATLPIDGKAGNDTLIGTNASDLIRGLGGNDVLRDLKLGSDTLDGGVGADTLEGLFGNDTYVVDSAADKIIELAIGGSGTDDRILASITIDLNNPNYFNVEHATLTGTAALNATGNGGANMLIGNSGANKIDGKGGTDTMIGRAGNDVYEVDEFADAVIEYAGEGVDQVNSSDDYFLGAFIENLTLTGTATVGDGNALANKITASANSSELSGRGGNDTLIGGNGGDFLAGGTGADSMIGGKGDDAYAVDEVGDKIAESGPASDVDRVFSTITYTLGANLENLDLEGVDAIDGTGNALGNKITGGDGVNVLSGRAGDDTLNGIDTNDGNDLFLGGDGKDLLFAGGDTDTLVGGAGSDVFGFDLDSLDGLDLVADFNGLPDGDQLDLSGVIGTLGKGQESLFIQTTTAGGSTTIRVDRDGIGVTFGFQDLAVLQGVSTDLEGLLANGAILNVGTPATPPIDGTAGVDNKAGTPISDLMRGLAGNDLLTGNGGADTLDGGTGTDTMVGGAGDDSYVVDNAKDAIVEGAGDLNDRVLASFSVDLNLPGFVNIEHATLTGIGALNATGNAGANMLIGNVGANKLDGKAGNDTMIGGAGNDVYEVDRFNDDVIEFAGEGVDQVNSSDSYILGAFIENLTLTGPAIDGFGNGLANKITGNAFGNFLSGGDGNDTLTGNDGNDFLAGGAGADSLVGGKGGDLYSVDDIGDKIMESGPAGELDQVVSTVTYTLGANLEVLGLQGAAAIDGTGNGLNNTLFGNSGNNVLSGLAGNDTLSGGLGDDLLLGGDGNDVLIAQQGADTLVGGAGSDRYEFPAAGLSGVDVIADFNGLPGGDTIDVSNLLSGFVEDVSNVNDFLRAVQANGSTTLQVDANGAAGGAVFVDMAVLQGVSTSISGLLNNGSLILD